MEEITAVLKYQIIFSSQANLDYKETIQYYLDHSTTIAQNFDNDLDEILVMIASSPEMFKRFEEAPRYRRTHLLKYKQQIIYQILKDEGVILIVAIMHHSRDKDRLARRLV